MPSATPNAHPPIPTSRYVLAAVSLANLYVLRLWAMVLDPATLYFLDGARPWQGFAGTLVVFAAFAAVGALLALRAARARGLERRAFEVIFFAAVAVALYGTREQIADLAGMPVRTYARQEGTIGTAAMYAGIVLFAAVLLPLRWRRPAGRALFTGLLVLSPFAAVTAGQTALGAWRAASGASAAAVAAKPPAPRAVLAQAGSDPVEVDAAPARSMRVVVVLLDEWDQFLTFEDRQAGLELPAIDALASESVHFRRALPPGRVTELVVPSLLSGRRVVNATDAGANDRRLWFEDGSSALFSDVPTFFTKLREADRNGGVAGWYHPYCRVIGDELADCTARAIRPEFAGMSVGEAAGWQAKVLLEHFPQGKKIRRRFRMTPPRPTPVAWHGESARILHAEALRLVADPSLDVVFAHYPVPHPPWLPVESGARGTYDSNLELTDRLLGELRDAIASSALAEETALIVLSDHPRRDGELNPLASERVEAPDRRPVPFLVRLPGAGAGRVDDRPVRTLVLHDLVLALVDGRIHTVEDLDRWLTEKETGS